MIYFKSDLKQNSVDAITKYEITFDEKELKELRDKIISSCSYVEHFEGVVSEKGIIHLEQDKTVINFKQGEKVGEKEYFDSADVDRFYNCSYDKLTISNLVSITDKLLFNDVSVIPLLESLFSDSYKGIETKKLKEELMQLSTKIDLIDNSNAEEKINAINEYNRLLIKYNQYYDIEKNEKQYIDEMKALVKVEVIDVLETADIEALNRLIGFFGGPNNFNKYISENYDLFKDSMFKERVLERKN